MLVSIGTLTGLNKIDVKNSRQIVAFQEKKKKSPFHFTIPDQSRKLSHLSAVNFSNLQNLFKSGSMHLSTLANQQSLGENERLSTAADDG